MGLFDFLGGGGSTTTVDNNNPYTNALARNVGASWETLAPMIIAGMQGKQTPIGELTTGTREQIMRHYGGRYGRPFDESFRRGIGQEYENLTKPTGDWMQLAGGLYGAGQPSAGGTTTTTQKQLSPMDYMQMAGTLALLL